MSTENEGCRPVRIFLAMTESCITKVIKKVLPVISGVTTHVYVDSHESADLVIFDNVRKIENGYDPERTYGFFGISNDRPEPFKGMIDISSAPVSILCMCEIIQKVWLTLKPLEVPVVEVEEETVPIPPDAEYVLVIDDSWLNRKRAKIVFAGKNLTVASGYQEGMGYLRTKKFDIVLTDMQLPMSSKAMGDKFQLGVLVHYGWLLRDEAARQGAKYVGVVTAVSHHDDAISAAIDDHGVVTRIENAKTLLIHARSLADGSKDWAGALKLLMEK